MSKIKPKAKKLAQSEVNKRIIARSPKVRPHEDLLGPFDRYNDENFEIYDKKRKQFFEAAKTYNRKNQETLFCSKERLNDYYLSNIKYEFLDDNEETKKSTTTSSSEGRKIRKRSVRYLNQVPEQRPQVICNLEPWFRRHLILNKFIWAARTVVIRNRLKRRLEILKKLDEKTVKELEDQGSKVYNVSYGDIFQKFLTIKL